MAVQRHREEVLLDSKVEGANMWSTTMRGDWRPFADSSPWNKEIVMSDVSTHSDSDAIVLRWKNNSQNKPRWPSAGHATESTAYPFYVFHGELPASESVELRYRYAISDDSPGIFEDFDAQDDKVADFEFPIHMWGMPEQHSDGHATCLQFTPSRDNAPFTARTIEMSRVNYVPDYTLPPYLTNYWSFRSPDFTPGELHCTTFNIWDLNGSGYQLADATFYAKRHWVRRGGRGSGFPNIAGLVRPEELMVGTIRHALVFASEVRYDAATGRGMCMNPPACRGDHPDQSGTTTAYPIEGMRIQLMSARGSANPADDDDFTSWGIPLGSPTRVVLRALAIYGAYCGDYAGTTGGVPFYLQGVGTTGALNESWYNSQFGAGWYREFQNKVKMEYFRVLQEPGTSVIVVPAT